MKVSVCLLLVVCAAALFAVAVSERLPSGDSSDAQWESFLEADSEASLSSESEADCEASPNCRPARLGKPAVESLTRVDDVAYFQPDHPWSDNDVTHYAELALHEARPRSVKRDQKNTDVLRNAVSEANRLLRAQKKIQKEY